MIDALNTLVTTYNTNVLDDLHIDLQIALKKEAELSKQTPNSSGSDREILIQLIKNHYDPDKIKPSAMFIGGPKTLSVHLLPKYQKLIYIFGEQHIDIMDCEKFENFDIDHDIITPIEDYLYKLIITTDVFIDIFLELHAYKSGEYPKNYIPFENMRGRLAKLFENFQKCLQKNTRHDENCKLARIHYFDIRTESDGKRKLRDIFWYHDTMESIINNHTKHIDILQKIEQIKDTLRKLEQNYSNLEAGFLYYFVYQQEFIKEDNPEMSEDEILEEIKRLWDESTVNSKNNWVKKELDRSTLGAKFRTEIEKNASIKYIFSKLSTKNEELYKKFWIQQITSDKFIMKEKKRKFENTDLKEQIIKFINSDMEKVAMRDIEQWQYYAQNIMLLINKKYTDEYDDVTLEIYIQKTIDLLLHPHAIIADFYTLLRMFTIFDMTDMEKAYTGATDQPSNASNIIIYAGDYHSDRYRRFLETIGNVPIETTGNFLHDDSLAGNCINMSDIRQPFFQYIF